MRATLICNTEAGRGRAARLLPAVREALASRGVVDVQLTTYPGEERELARAAARDGAGTIIALGGDGTWGNVARGILTSGAEPRLALLAAGTGNDLAFTTGVPATDLRAALGIALGSDERRIDVGSVDGVHFLNVAGFGFDAEVLQTMGQVRWLRGHAVYLAAAARQLFGYRGMYAHLRLDGDAAALPARRAHHLAVIIANGPRIGGGFMIAPEARIDDGMLDVVRIADTTPWRRMSIFAAATRGAHVGMPEISIRRAATLDLSFESPPLFDADGELHQATAAGLTVLCHPAALRLAAPAR